MAQEVNIITKHIQKHDTEQNWNLSSLKPAVGQLIVYDPDDNYNYARFKIGDGATIVKDLPFTVEETINEALATLGTLANKSTIEKADLSDELKQSLESADSALQSFTETDPTVPAWAKAATKPTYNQGEVADTADYVRMTPAERTKLGKIAEEANKYVHPTHTTASSDLYKVEIDDQGHVKATTKVTKADITDLDIPGQDTTYTVKTEGTGNVITNVELKGTQITATKGETFITSSEKGTSLATLEDGKIPASQLPSYVDDVIEYNTTKPRPSTGEAGKIYVNTDDNKTYRWSGSAYVEISKSLALGETSSTAFAGDKGKAAYEHSSETATVGNNPHGITKETLGVVETYTNTDPLLANVGGILASKHNNGFNNVPIIDLITELLYPYTKPAVSNFAMTPATGVKEMNSPIKVTKATITVTKKSKNIASINLYKGSTLVQSITDNIATSGAATYTFTLEDSLDGSTDTSYKIIVKDTDGGETTTSNLTYDFVFPYFYGTIAAGLSEITSDTVLGLNKNIRAKGSCNFTFTTNNQCPVIAYPASYGNLKSIIDPNNFSQTWTKYEVTINSTNINGINYYVYVGGAATAENVKYTFNY